MTKLDEIAPDLIVLDESEELSNADSAAARRLDRYRLAHPVRITALWTREQCIAARRARGVSAADDREGCRRAARMYRECAVMRFYTGQPFETSYARAVRWDRRHAK